MELQIHNLSKTYRNGVRALNGITLTIPRGMFGLLGPNGAGKSTLLEDRMQYWTPAEQNTRLIGFPEMLLWNRLFWLGFAAALLLLLLLRFRIAHPASSAGRRRRTAKRAARRSTCSATASAAAGRRSRSPSPRRPARAGMDPHHKLIQREMDDNEVEVRAASGTVATGVRVAARTIQS